MPTKEKKNLFNAAFHLPICIGLCVCCFGVTLYMRNISQQYGAYFYVYAIQLIQREKERASKVKQSKE